MFNNIVLIKLNHYFNLIRLDKPVGIFLLMWPCFFALAIIYELNNYNIYWFIYFFIGSFLMRAAGCIINDLVDINLDKKIDRTANRPLTSNKITIAEAFFILTILLISSFIILLEFNYRAILIGIASMPLVVIYPFLKRYTYWPQLGLGIVFNWGVFIVSVQFMQNITFDFLLLYIGCVFWTLGYDTIYAYQDLKDDIKNNIKSTAVLFGDHGKKFVMFFYSIFLIIIGFIGFYSSKNFISLIVIILLIFAIGLYLNKWKLNSITSSNNYFKFNNIIGLICFLYLFVF